MDFVTALEEYFTKALDASMYITYAILTIALVILIGKQNGTVKHSPLHR